MKDFDIPKYIYDACISGNLNILIEFNRKCDNNAASLASSYGHLHIVKHLYENGTEFDSWSIAFAARHNHYEIVKYLYENNAPIDDKCISYAISSGSLEIVKYLIRRVPIGPSAMRCACASGHLHIVKYLISPKNDQNPNITGVTLQSNIYKPIPIDMFAMENACIHGHFHIVRELVIQIKDIIVTEKALEYAEYNGHYELLVYLLECGYIYKPKNNIKEYIINKYAKLLPIIPMELVYLIMEYIFQPNILN